MDLKLNGKIILISGGASGIGKEIALQLSKEGAVVCILDNNEKNLAATQDEILSQGGEVLTLRTELTRLEDCKSAVDTIIKEYHKIDGLVNNAGLNDGVSLESGSSDAFIESLDRNVIHYQTLFDLCTPWLEKSEGSVVNICSKIAETGQGGSSGYAAANGARAALTEYWAKNFGPRGIRVNGVVVAECWTPQYEWWIARHQNPEQKLIEITSNIPLGGRMTTVQEIAATVVFLLSVVSSGFQGQLIHVDGGYVHLDRARIFP